MKKILLVLTIALGFTACVTSNNQVSKAPPSTEEQEIAQLMENMEQAWNSKDTAAYATYWHKDLQMIITDLKTRRNFTVDYNTFMKMIPERMEKIGKVRFRELEILNISDNKAKIFINLKKPDRSYPNYFNLIRDEKGNWQVISNEIARK